ncbi:MAG: glycogen/starch/alpha-glucan phosphorylase [Nitrospinae bacterium]|nr:glycogen/starch/alpha-glucan phosphorylase [Nitrospinota bacterium]
MVDKDVKKEVDAKKVEEIKESIKHHILSTIARDPERRSKYDVYKGVAYAIRDLLIERWLKTQRAYYKANSKRVYYLSMEFLEGRALGNALINLGIMDEFSQAVHDLGYELEDLRELEWDAGLGNGGLGRLAACFLDSLATLEIPSYGYGIHYEYGIFYQSIVDGYQVETPDHWLRFGNPWEYIHPGFTFPIKFHGRVQTNNSNGRPQSEWIDTEEVLAVACDTPVPGYNNNHVINLRLWAAKSSRDFDLKFFNKGDYIRAVESKLMSETISKVLYPADHQAEGRELRLKQQYFLVSATIQDIIRRYKKYSDTYDSLPDKVAIQLNDTHPSLAIAELMRILVDNESLEWENAWDIAVGTFGYTNHTILPEALEKWPVALLGKVLPRHLEIIEEIDRRFMMDAARHFPGDINRIRGMSIFEDTGLGKMVKMANLSIIGSHSVNGVSALHTKILKEEVFKDFYTMYPERFSNKTNGITPRRWLKKANPLLAELITSRIGDGWVTDLDQLKKLVPLADDNDFIAQWGEVKKKNKEKLAVYIRSNNEIDVDVNSIFDVQIKRMHEYKRQLLNLFHAITLYNRIKNKKDRTIFPRTIMFGGKAAPSYYNAKLIIKLINSVADIVNHDKEVSDKLKIIFLQNYSVSLAEKVIPAADLSEQISTAGKEASGTGNMKFALNGALTIGTLDGANIEIREEVGDENIFIFGLTNQEVKDTNRNGYNPTQYYEQDEELRTVIDMVRGGYFSTFQPNLFKPITDSLLQYGDPYMLLADYRGYVECQERVAKTYPDSHKWNRMSILNVANMGKFSSDRAIKQYAEEIWNAKPVHVE